MSIPVLEEKEDGLRVETMYMWYDHKKEDFLYNFARKVVSKNSPFLCAERCTISGEYLGLIRNPDYNTDWAVFKVNDQICNKEVISYFNRMRTEIEKEGKTKNVKVSF